MKVKLTLSYDGKNYSGWQVQENAITIQQVVENAIYELTGKEIKVTASGRTDAGVHAKGQVISFENDTAIPPEKFYRALNAHLPLDIRAIDSERADDDFDANRSAKKKTYSYSIYFGQVENPLIDKYSQKVEGDLDFSLMKKCAKRFVGTHDFKSFCASKSSAKTTVRTIYSIKIKRDKTSARFIVSGNGFLYNMVRTLVGTLIKAGRGDLNKCDIQKILEGDRSLCGTTMPAKALILESVEY